MNVLIAGGTGLVGQRLTELLIEKGYGVHVLTRQDISNKGGVKYFKWTIGQAIDMAAFKEVVAIVNLTGEGIADQRWTEKRKSALKTSRIAPAEFLLQVMKSEGIFVPVYCGASGVNYYAPSPSKIYNENDGHAKDFIGLLCRDWENQAQALTSNADRVVIFRTGVVLAKANSFLQKFTATTRFFVAGIFGHGKQPLSWIHIDDLCVMYIYAIEHKSVNGAINAAVCNETSHLSFIQTFLKRLKRKALIVKAPRLVAKLVFGEMGTLLTDGVAVSSKKIKQTGYQFKFEGLEDAIDDLIK